MSSRKDDTTRIDPETVQEACNFSKKNVCFIGNLLEEPLKGTLSKFGHCAYGTTGQQSKKGLIDLVVESNPDEQFIQRILIHDAQSAVAERESKAIVLAMFGYEKYYEDIVKAVSVPILKPSSALVSMLDERECTVGLIGISFDLNQELWDQITQQHKIKVVMPEKSASDKLSLALRRATKLNGQEFKTELEQICSEQVKAMLNSSDSPSRIIFCNIELSNALKRIKCENRGVEFVSISDVLRQLVVNFNPSE